MDIPVTIIMDTAITVGTILGMIPGIHCTLPGMDMVLIITLTTTLTGRVTMMDIITHITMPAIIITEKQM